MDRRANKSLESCPHLPSYTDELTYRSIRELGRRRDELFYRTCLEYSQFLWTAGKPAQAILQLNRAWSADLPPDAPVLESYPPPYMALRWILEHRHEAGFIGNPVRHFQHLATRISGPRKLVRSWRAWACFHLSEKLLSADDFPRDELQISSEELVIPSFQETEKQLNQLGWMNELQHYRSAL